MKGYKDAIKKLFTAKGKVRRSTDPDWTNVWTKSNNVLDWSGCCFIVNNDYDGFNFQYVYNWDGEYLGSDEEVTVGFWPSMHYWILLPKEPMSDIKTLYYNTGTKLVKIRTFTAKEDPRIDYNNIDPHANPKKIKIEITTHKKSIFGVKENDVNVIFYPDGSTS